MSTHMPGFQSFSGFLHYYEMAKSATSSIRVNRLKHAFYGKRLMYKNSVV